MQQALLALRAMLLPVRHPDLRSIGPISRRSLSIARGWAVPRKSVVGALRSLELLLRDLEQARTSLAAVAPAICPVENCCGRTGRHPVFPCNLPRVPARRQIWVHLVGYVSD